MKDLLEAGLRLESVREAFSYLRDHLGEDVASVNLVISGRHMVLVRTGEEIIDLLRQGQGVLNILPLAGVKDEVDAAILEAAAHFVGGDAVEERLLRSVG